MGRRSSLERRIVSATRSARAKARAQRPDLRARKDLLDRLGTVIVDDVVIQVDEFGGQFAVDSRSALFRRIVDTGRYEPVLTQLCRSHIDPDRDVLDVGANIGFHTVLFASSTKKRVLAIEPTVAASARLRANVARNGRTNVIVWQGAASDHRGSLELSVIEGREEFSSAHTIVHAAASADTTATERVDCDTLDGLVERFELSPGFVKLDVEGGEFAALVGADHILSTCRPVIVSELSKPLLASAGSSSAEVIRLLKSYDYAIVDAVHPRAPAGERDYGDILCLPL